MEEYDRLYALNRLSTTVSPDGVTSSAITHFNVSRSFAAFVAAENNATATFATRVATLNSVLSARNGDAQDAALSELAAQSTRTASYAQSV
jgi:predicted kinase